jgi:uncharacterized protein (TIGR02996 family)
MTHDEAFLRAILADPGDDGVRLAYADFLEEHGRLERADFIRLQCLRAALPCDDPWRPRLMARERELVRRHGRGWVGALRPWLLRGTFRRGFVEQVTVSAQVYLDHGADLARFDHSSL